MRLLAIVWMLFAAAPALTAAEPSILNPSGLTIPRYVSLKYDEVNVRVGPGTRYPIRYVYKRANLPVQIIEEFAHWRKIADYGGASGWVHKNMLDGTRNALIMDKTQSLYARPDAGSRAVLRAGALVVGRLMECKTDWCELEIKSRTGWIRKANIWGVTREEVLKQ